MRTKEALGQRAAELAERSRAASACAAEALASRWHEAESDTCHREEKE